MKLFKRKILTPVRVFQSAWDFFGRTTTHTYRRVHQSAATGTVALYTDPLVSVIRYGSGFYDEHCKVTLHEALNLLNNCTAGMKCWLDVDGTGNLAFVQRLGTAFGLHELEVEDIANLYQRPKVELYDDHLFVVSRMIYYTQKDNSLVNEQVSFVVKKNVLLTVQEENEDAFEGVRHKLRKGVSQLSESGVFQLMWSLMDAIVDNYFPMLERIGNDLDRIEDELLMKPGKAHLTELQQIKREVFFLRKSIWAERDKLGELLRNDSPLIDDKSRVYLRDTYDHTVQIMDITEAHKEISYSLMEIYLSSQNNRLSEVMKVLTVVSSIFIPLTFIVGVYGMNFQTEDRHGNPLPWNMPEVFHPYGYVLVMAAMAVIAMGQFIYFKRKGWL